MDGIEWLGVVLAILCLALGLASLFFLVGLAFSLADLVIRGIFG